MFSSLLRRRADKASAETPVTEDSINEPSERDTPNKKRSREETDTTVSGEPSGKFTRYELDDEIQGNQWELSEDQATYLNKYMSKHLSQKELKEKVTDEYPVPMNIKNVPVLDNHIKELLQEGQKTDSLHVDKTLKTIQDSVASVFGPLCTLWSWLEGERNEARQENLPDTLAEPSKLFDQCMILLAQAFNAISYQRRAAILSKLITSQSVVKEILRTQSDTLNNPGNDQLFGPSFDKQLADESSTRAKAKSIFSGLKKVQPTTGGFRGRGYPRGRANRFPRGTFSFPATRTGRWPFRGGPRPTFQTRGRGQSFGQGNNWRPSFGKGKKFFPEKLCTTLQSVKGSSNPNRAIPFNASGTSRGSGKDKALPKKLGDSESGSADTGYCEGFLHSLPRGTNSAGSAPPLSDECEGAGTSGRRGSGDAPERSYPGSFPNSGSICKFYFSSGQKGLGTSSCDKFKEAESVHSLSALQDGVSRSVEGPSSPKGLDGEGGLERCLLLHPFKGTVSEICQISLEGKTLPIHLSMLRVSSSSKSIFKTFENSNGITQKVECQASDLSGRYLDNGSLLGGDPDGQGFIDFHTPMPGFHNESEKVCIDTCPKDRVSGSRNRFGENDALFAREEEDKDCGSVSVCVAEGESFLKNLSQDCRNPDCVSSCCSPCPTSSTSSTAGTDKGLGCRQQFRKGSEGDRGDEGGTVLVGRKLTLERWEKAGLPLPRSGDSIRCLQKGLGCSLSGPADRRSLVSFGEEFSHQCLRAQGSFVGNENLCQNISHSQIFAPSDGQSHSSVVHSKARGHSESGALSVEQGTVGLSVVQGDHSYSRVPTGDHERNCGSRVSACSGFKRMDALSKYISPGMSTVRCANDRSVCIKGIPSASPVFCLETRPIQPREGCVPGLMDTSQRLCISPILPHGEGSKEGRSGSGNNNVSGTCLARPALVPQTSSTSNKEPFNSSNAVRSVNESERGESSHDSWQQSEVSSLDGIREIGFDSGVSKKAASLIASSRRDSTRSHYKSAWGKWTSWCTGRQVDPVRSSINDVLNFLAHLFEKGLEYNTIAGYRSAISAYHDPIDGVRVGSHPKVSTLITGVFNERCPKPKFCFVWDVENVLRYLKSLGSVLSDKMLTMKVTMLLALASVCRAHEIKYLDKDFMIRTEEKFVFHFGVVTKTARPGKMRPPVTFYKLSQDPDLCVHKILDQYLEKCKEWGMDKGQLLVSHKSPHGPVSISTVSRWLLDTLELAGIDVKKFKGHSTRSASSSKGASLGLSTKMIMKRGHWSRESTFQRFYYRPVKGNEEKDFQQKVLGSASK